MTFVSDTLNIFAPAKVNLYLHLTGRRDDGYHLLDSLVAFADIGDRVRIEPATDFTFAVEGPFARAFTAQEKDASPNSSNLVVRAVWAMAEAMRRPPAIRVTLEKNIPLAAGIGGGSSDAAAVIWGLIQLWNIKLTAAQWLPKLMLGLGADVPVCLPCQPVRMRGIGDEFSPVPSYGDIPILLVNPGARCPTADVFRLYDGGFRSSAPALAEGQGPAALAAALRDTGNDLTVPAMAIVPDIATVLEMLEQQPQCLLSRMSGSGATCFGIFEDETSVLDAAEHIMRAHPGWWVRGGMLNRPQRY